MPAGGLAGSSSNLGSAGLSSGGATAGAGALGYLGNQYAQGQNINNNLSGGITNGNNTQTTGTTGTNANIYDQGQQALQGTLTNALSNLTSTGQTPNTFTAPQALIDQYNQQFSNTVAPGLANQYGANSPQIASQQNQGLVNLLGNQYNTGVGNYLNALNAAAPTAFQALGTSATGNQNVAANQNTQAASADGTSLNPAVYAALIRAIQQQAANGSGQTNGLVNPLAGGP